MRGVVILAMAVMVSAQETNGPDGQLWIEMSQGERLAYVLGWMDGFDNAVGPFSYFSGNDLNKRKFAQAQVLTIVRCTEAMNAAQIKSIFDKFVSAKPEHRREPLPALTMRAMLNACKSHVSGTNPK